MIPVNNDDANKLEVQVILSEDDAAVYVKLTGFENLEDADMYANYLVDRLPLMLFETEILH
jgi:hypothetical protein